MITQDELDKAREFCIEAGAKAFVTRDGMTPEVARKRVRELLDAPWPEHWPPLPTFDEL